jgi:mycothiol synthase
VTVEAPEYLDDGALAAVRTLQDAARAVDGTEPFSEQVTMRWSGDGRPRDGEWHLLARDATGAITGYAHRDPTGTAELAVHPARRRTGFGSALLSALESLPAEAGLQVWSHGDQFAAREFAAARGYAAVRELLQLRRELSSDPAPDGVRLPPGVTLRPFRPGQDDGAWLELNARAFAHHPEQGAWTQDDLADRVRQPWFDPEGFLLAERDGRLAGFHWTKIADGLGEVYVLGVAPQEQGGGLGMALTLAGLRYLFSRGVPAVTLYVEANNQPALALYLRLEFEHWHADVMYARP